MQLSPLYLAEIQSRYFSNRRGAESAENKIEIIINRLGLLCSDRK
jgi:hypothetical protein